MTSWGSQASNALSRRVFLARAGALAVVGWSTDVWCAPRARALRALAASVAAPAGTTLEATLVRAGAGPYVHIGEGPGWPIVVRPDLAAPEPGREERRVALATIVQLTDVHLVDAQSPARVEFLDRLGPPFDGAFRAQEVLTVHVAISMVDRIRAVGRGPVTGRAFDCAVSTGDNIDNQQHNELDWFFGILDGGSIVPDSGAIGTYEGVQDTVDPDPHYWHPDPVVVDQYKTTWGFPAYPDLLAAAIAPVQSPGLPVRWYSTYGNHDGLVQCNAPGWYPGDIRPFDAIATGSLKPTNLSPALSPGDVEHVLANPQLLLDLVSAFGTPVRTVTPDAGRRAVAPAEWVARHLAPSTGPGPAGHGFDAGHLDGRSLYYTFPVAEGVVGVALDTVNHGGYADGSISVAQLGWLEARLIEAHSRFFDTGGAEVRTGNADQLVVLFSHHNTATMQNPLPDPSEPGVPRVLIDEVLATLRRFPNIVLWVNGHTHVNRVTPVPDPTGRTGGFWEINTAAHVDYPEHARIVEVVDNRDGTLSVFATIVDHAAPAAPGSFTAPSEPARRLALAAISRELSANDPQTNYASKLGAPIDLNVELLIAAPFTVTPAPAPVVTTTSTTAAAGPGRGDTLPPTGADLSLPVALAGAGLAAALAARRRLSG